MSNLKVAALVTTALAATACTHFDKATLVTSTATLAWDWSQTRGAAEQGFSGARHENNPIMGSHPSPGQVDVYFVSTVLINTALWLMLPKSWRSVIPASVTLVQTRQVYMNAQSGSTGLFH